MQSLWVFNISLSLCTFLYITSSYYFYNLNTVTSFLLCLFCMSRLPPGKRVGDERKELLYTSLYLLIWGEAANLRFMPECLCFIFHNVRLKILGAQACYYNNFSKACKQIKKFHIIWFVYLHLYSATGYLRFLATDLLVGFLWEIYAVESLKLSAQIFTQTIWYVRWLES